MKRHAILLRYFLPGLSLGLLLITLTRPIQATDSEPTVVNATNITHLQPVAQIDFARYAHDTGPFNTGWFATNSTGDQFMAVNQINQVVTWDSSGSLFDVVSVMASEETRTTFIDGAFAENTTTLVTVHQGDGAYFLRAAQPGQAERYIAIQSPNFPLNLWLDAENAWLEISPAAPQDAVFILQVPLATFASAPLKAIPEADFTALPYTPAADLDAFARIGRIPPPFAITSSIDGVVKRWDLESGTVAAEAQVQAGPVVFGQINATGSHLAWRDTESHSLHLLSFETDEDQIIAPLNGQYVQWFFLTLQADVILGVNIGFDPVVVAWDVETGQRYELGPYRACDRVPDMARMSADGTTLVIGCNTGLDIWRVYEAK